ncbi:PorP/SprF family type IX secretion system membrane protein [Aureisphaera galaxeae]|uniref:PorP/SprF family type IX secretion system membrane protein n=1 Tax=Aureisphaera galaxeae TaxID=1538023 RepID=UPI00234FF7D2|nr:PorP/SprF family type IX secretion system membrane protein [Aureisphaera galaxeae]MDC8002588.1 PorP/SprF family type IX secretion system membrane protein [Aureisphaera galaxeae]
MRTLTIYIILFFCFATTVYSQDGDGVVALDIPARNSLMFNRFIAQPTFSFVREQNKYITVTNKRELVEVEDAPLTYFFNYSGRIRENIGAGIGVYQQNYGVLTTFGGILNFAYNIQAEEDSNITFGINVGAYQSGLDSGKVVTNFDDPALNNIPSNFLLTIHPGINYGTGFMDFGLSLNNVVTYNFNTSGLVEDNPKQGVQGHMMYTGYFSGYGFFGQSRFSALARSEFQKDNTIVSGAVMLTVPKGIWAQVGYNTMYGASGGLGVNLTPQIAVEYNYERPIVGLTNLGAAHEITLAYRFKNNNYYKYSRDDELSGLFNPDRPRRRRSTKKPVAKVQEPKEDDQAKLEAEEQARIEAEEQARLAAEEQARLEAEEQARLDAEAEAQREADDEARREAEAQAKREAEAQARREAEAQAKREAEAQARREAEAQAKREAEEQARRDAEAQAKREAEERTRLEAEAQAKREAEEQARLEAEAQAKREAEEQARREAEAQAKREAEEQARREAEAQAKREAEEQARLEAEAQAKREAEEQARREAEAQAKREAEEQARLEAEAQAKREAEEQARREAEEQARLEAEEQARLEAEEQARIEAEEQAKREAEEQARLEAERLAREQRVKNPQDAIGRSISELAQETEETRKEQEDLIKQLEDAVAVKEQDLKDLKEENDLSEQNIYVEPKPFKSVTAENQAIELLKIDLDTIILRQEKKIAMLESLLEDRKRTISDPRDETNVYYQNEIATLKKEQAEAIRRREFLVSSLEQISIATDFERKRRIKRAAYDNDQDRYQQDRNTLSSLKRTVTPSDTPLPLEEYDFGKQRSGNIEILKDVKNTENGYYLVLAVHNDVLKRDKFLVQVLSSGYKDVDFFFNVDTSEYYIYAKKFTSINEAENALRNKGNEPYNEKMSIIKIENQ